MTTRKDDPGGVGGSIGRHHGDRRIEGRRWRPRGGGDGGRDVGGSLVRSVSAHGKQQGGGGNGGGQGAGRGGPVTAAVSHYFDFVGGTQAYTTCVFSEFPSQQLIHSLHILQYTYILQQL